MVDPAMWGCAFHWRLLPWPIRRRILEAYQPGQENDLGIISDEYVAAYKSAVDWIADNHSPAAAEYKS